MPGVALSIVSHGQGELIGQLLSSLTDCEDVSEVIVVQNIPEREISVPEGLRDKIRTIKNSKPMGFASNHNQAFSQCSQPYFLVANPDITLGSTNPIPGLLNCVEQTGCALAVPIIRNPRGEIEDSIRRFPTPLSLLRRALKVDDDAFRNFGGDPQPIEWAAGMFMLFRSDDFRVVSGFDEGYFLYFEDVDICARLWKSGRSVFVCPGNSAIHDARRTSHRNFKYLKWHISSMFRYFAKHLGRLPDIKAIK